MTKSVLTLDQARDMLPDAETVHYYKQGDGKVAMGSDMPMKDVLALLEGEGTELSWAESVMATTGCVLKVVTNKGHIFLIKPKDAVIEAFRERVAKEHEDGRGSTVAKEAAVRGEYDFVERKGSIRKAEKQAESEADAGGIQKARREQAGAARAVGQKARAGRAEEARKAREGDDSEE